MQDNTGCDLHTTAQGHRWSGHAARVPLPQRDWKTELSGKIHQAGHLRQCSPVRLLLGITQEMPCRGRQMHGPISTGNSGQRHNHTSQ